MLKYLTPLLLLLPSLAAQAQGLGVEEEPEVRRYAVEVIIFRYAQAVGTGSEIFAPEEARIEEFALRDAAPPVVEIPAAADSSTFEFVSDIQKLEEDEYTMIDILGKLNRLDVYEPIMHFGWAQSTWPEHQKEPIKLSLFAQPPDELEGDLTLYLSRFLHLVVDLQLNEPRAQGTVRDDPVSSYGDYRTLNEIPNRMAPIHYRIEEDRIFRSGELRYYDHPKFGVLARVTRIEGATHDPEVIDADEASELLGYPVE